MSKHLRFMGGLSTLALLAVPGIALGQSTGSAGTSPAAAPAVTDGAEQTAANTLGDIVVTAQRRSENLQKVAISVSAVSGSALANASVSEAANLTKLVPALVVQTAGGGSNFFVRGIGATGTGAFAENPVAFNIDSVYIGRPTALAGTFYDVERVEVLKGPQGTLYGRNATGGAINVITAQPQLDHLGGSATVEIGNYQQVRAQAAVNLPLGSNVALRFAGQTVYRNGYQTDGYDDELGRAARGQLLFKPDDSLSIVLGGDYYHQGGRGSGAVLAGARVADGSFVSVPFRDADGNRIGGASAQSIALLTGFFPTQLAAGTARPPQTDGFYDSNYWGARLGVDKTFGLGTLSFVGAYRRSQPKYLAYNQGFSTSSDEDTRQDSLEVRFASNKDQFLTYVIGAYYFHQRSFNYVTTRQGLIAGTTATDSDLFTRSGAAFGQASANISDSFRITGGIRYTKEHKTQNTIVALRPATAPVATGDRTFSSMTWKAGVEYDVAPRSLLYANVSTGFKAGGFFGSTLPKNYYDPEKIIAYVAGSKNRFFNNRLQVNAEAFYMRYTNQQIGFVGPVQTTPGVFGQAGVIYNIGSSDNYGGEVEVDLAVGRGGRFNTSVQYLHSKYDSFNYTTIGTATSTPNVACPFVRNTTIVYTAPTVLYDVNCSGRPGLNAPKWVANIGYEQRVPIGDGLEVIGGIRTRLESSRYLRAEYLELERQGAYRMSDATLGIESADGWSLTGFINNIEDRDVLAGATARPTIQAVYVNLRPPRTYGARFSFHY